MTKEEASFYLANMDRRYMEEGMSEALDMAIQALEQEPCDDAQECYEDLCEYFGDAKDILKSRKDFKAWLGRVKWHIHKAEELYEKYEQEPKTGHWIKLFLIDTSDIDGQCSECGFIHRFIDGYTAQYDYCPNCGARMIEPQESELENPFNDSRFGG